MDSLHQNVQLVRRYQTGVIMRISAICADVDDPNSIMCIQYSDGVARTDCQPLFQIASSMIEYCMQHKGRQSEIIDAIHLTSYLNLPAKMGMDFDKHFHLQFCSLLSKSIYKGEGFRDHEATA